ncbi:MAG: DUF2892 domain-containing protein [Saprospiraceae bacterium]|nr:DUF2892 domain-containing protein [Saprospiraceae bacterium]HRG69292.1 DUF2892 domain-containing protein [Saprospiraceae bacterium]
MKKNMGFLDVTIRLVLAALIVGLYMGNIITGMVATVLLLLAAVFLITSSLSFCPLYLPFGISTRKGSEA